MKRCLVIACLSLLVSGCGQDAPINSAARPAETRGARETPQRISAPGVFCDDAGQYFSTRDGVALLLVPAGDFALGDTQGRYDEQPVFHVRLGAFFIDTTEVSNEQFARFVNASSYSPEGPWKRGYSSGQEDLPVRFVSWNDAAAYAKWAGRRLPTEAEWEAACGHSRYPWGDDWLPGCAITDRDAARGPVEVGIGTDRSPFGVLNLGGNVREWCSDWYDRYAYTGYANSKTIENPAGPVDGAGPAIEFIKAGAIAGNERSTRKVVRGASWAGSGRECARRSRRGAHNPQQWFDDVGFRCVQSVEEKP